MITIVGNTFSVILRDAFFIKFRTPSGRAEKTNSFSNVFLLLSNFLFSSARPEGIEDASRRIADIVSCGKRMIVLYLLLLSSFTFPTSISLKLTTLDGDMLEQAGIGQPFLLNVVVTNTSNSAQYPTIKGIENIHVRQSGFQMNMVNGATSVTYHYRVRIDTAGNYTLGPATIIEANDTIESDPIIVTVGDQQKSKGKRTPKAQAQAPIIKLVCDKTNVYVGQKINAELSFYTSDPTMVLQTIIEPEQISTTGLVFKNKQNQPTTGTEKINGVEHRFAKWTFQIIPIKAGTLVLPAYAAQYTSQANQPMLSFFFHHDAKRVYSNTITLDVMPLPHSLKQPSFIGTISEIQASINPSTARVGQGMVYSISLSGDGDFESIGMLPLSMPEECKWYESKHYYTPGSNQSGTYTMEYIAQALQPGTLTIPKQDFFYFDTNAKKYKTISTAPISVTISGNAITQSPSSKLENSVDIPAEINPLAPINQIGPVQDDSSKPIPWYMFWLLLTIIGILWGTYIIFSMSKNALKRFVTYIFKKRVSLYVNARQCINNAYQQKKYAEYYSCINQLFASRLRITQGQLTPEIIENSLRQDGLSAQALDDWRTFYAEIAQISFYKPNLDAQYYKDLTQKTYYWIDVLEQLPRVHL